MKKLILCILDGFALESSNSSSFNAVKEQGIENLSRIFKNYPTVQIEASGEFVGLPDLQMGNSEVGHLTIGSGQIPMQSLTLINDKIRNDSLFNSDDLKKIKKSKRIHIVGLFSKGGVHSHENHFYYLIDKFKENQISLHLFTDGRDCDVNASIKDFKDLEDKIKAFDNISISTICGRFYGMDRDMNLDRTESAFENILNSCLFYNSALEGIEDNYKNGISDEFIKPFAIKNNYKNIQEGDSVIFANFRIDRMRQVCSLFLNQKNKNFRREFLKIEKYSMTDYFLDSEEGWQNDINIILERDSIKNTLSEIISNNNLSQVKITETEKYAHLTFFLNGLNEKPFLTEKRILIKSEKMDSYDKKPEMSIDKLEEEVLKEINNNTNVIFINVPNCDMVGHSGNKEAAKKAVFYVDRFVEIVKNKALVNNYTMIITSDHGNIEDMGNEKSSNTAHTNSKVPFCIISNKQNIKLKEGGSLSNIAATILDLLEIKKGEKMEHSLIEKLYI